MYQTMIEIENAYNGYWVFMTHCRTGEHNEVIGGRVIAYNKEKKPIADLWGKTYDTEVYLKYIGSIPEGMGVLL